MSEFDRDHDNHDEAADAPLPARMATGGAVDGPRMPGQTPAEAGAAVDPGDAVVESSPVDDAVDDAVDPGVVVLDAGPADGPLDDQSTVAAVLRELDRLPALELAEHPDVYQRVHAELQGALAAIDDA